MEPFAHGSLPYCLCILRLQDPRMIIQIPGGVKAAAGAIAHARRRWLPTECRVSSRRGGRGVRVPPARGPSVRGPPAQRCPERLPSGSEWAEDVENRQTAPRSVRPGYSLSDFFVHLLRPSPRAFVSTSSVRSAMNSFLSRICCFLPAPLLLTATVPASASRSPITTMYGILCSSASRIR